TNSGRQIHSRSVKGARKAGFTGISIMSQTTESEAAPMKSGNSTRFLPRVEQWRKNQIAVNVSGAFLFFGYTLVMPFLPIYVRQLGVQSTAAVAFSRRLILS